MELIGISDPLPDFPDRKSGVGEQLFGLVDSDIGQVFQRGISFVAVKYLGKICGSESHGGGEGTDVDIIHIMISHVENSVLHDFLGMPSYQGRIFLEFIKLLQLQPDPPEGIFQVFLYDRL